MGYIPGVEGWFNNLKSINFICHTNKEHMIISTDVRKIDKIQHSFMIRTLNKLGIKEAYLNIIKAICDKPTVDIPLNSEIAESFSSETKMPMLTTFIKHYTGSCSQRN